MKKTSITQRDNIAVGLKGRSVRQVNGMLKGTSLISKSISSTKTSLTLRDRTKREKAS